MARRRHQGQTLDDDPLWYRDAVIYELHVRAFSDHNADGIGDFRGLTEKLDYLQDLGVTALWLLPFYPSPLKDDGYDIANFTEVHPDYGTLHDFRQFLEAAHRRGLRVITELVLNHTSDQHRWFQRARRGDAAHRWRDFYVWSDTAERYGDTRIIFQDFETSNWTWDRDARAYYWHRFYSHQPDLNFDHPQVRREMLRVLDFWLEMGVDGLRLDAVPYLYEREGTSCENLPETHDFLKLLRSHVDRRFANRMLLAEANQWPEDAVAYFGAGDECHMAFHFPLMPRLFMALHMEDRFPILDILDQTPTIPEGCQWGLFLRNHDELTLEMVTDEERDYMYRVYATDPRARINLGIRRRLAPLLGNDRRKIELLNGILFSLPGTPVLYYGDEIGMGDNYYLGDRNGVRTPMQWSADRNAGFSRTNPQRLFLPPIVDPEYHFEAVNVETQRNNPSSLFWWMKRLIALRKQYQAFSRGDLEVVLPDNAKVLAYTRHAGAQSLLVAANLSRFAQHVELDLGAHAGATPVELFGRTPFPRVTAGPYCLTLGPHAFYWFLLEPERAATTGIATAGERALPTLAVSGGWLRVAEEPARTRLQLALVDYLPRQRWFANKTRSIKAVDISETIALPPVLLLVLDVDFHQGERESYLLPLTVVEGPRPGSPAAVATLSADDAQGLLVDASGEPAAAAALLAAIQKRRRLHGGSATLVASRTEAFAALTRSDSLEPTLLKGEQSNTSIVYGQCLVLKLLRHLQPGQNPELEIGRFLTATGFSGSPAVVGSLELHRGSQEPVAVGILHAFVTNQGDAWRYTLEALERYFEHVMALSPAGGGAAIQPEIEPFQLAGSSPPETARELIGSHLEAMSRLGQRIGELHLALSSRTDSPAFAPEPFSVLYQRALFQSMRTLAGRTFAALRGQLAGLPEAVQEPAAELLRRERHVLELLRAITGAKLSGMRCRAHGDLRLARVLHTGKDFVIIDFEGEPARSMSERRLKRSPLRDVAGMLRSLHCAAYGALYDLRDRGLAGGEQLAALQPWVRFWYTWVSTELLRGYLSTARQGSFLPQTTDELHGLLNAFLLEKAISELGSELNDRPSWVEVPLRGILELTETGAA